MNRIIASFIQGCKKDHFKYHLTKLYALSQPKQMGGWGILDLSKFRKVLLCKSMWQAVMGNSLWSSAIRAKYMNNRDMSFWIRENHIGTHGSAIWRDFRALEFFFRQNLIRKFQKSAKLIIGQDWRRPENTYWPIFAASAP